MVWWIRLVALAAVLGRASGGPCQGITVTKLDLFQATTTDPGTTDNNLQNGGRLVYRNAGKVKQAFGPDKDLSLIVTKRPGTQYFSMGAGRPRNDVASNGQNGKFGNINIKNNPEQNPDQIGEGKFTFCIVDAATEAPISLDFNFFFFDLDNRNDQNGQIGLHERVEVFGYQDILETDVNPKQYTISETNNRAIVRATTDTGFGDNPAEPNSLTNDQQAKSIGEH